ncbi:EamA family transporter RarD [Sporolactobacillus laevolacticus]|uniref:EamA family transporter RarD n=1 Tax=Sporolactobacillus laevolacticus TaxID=33018 RepID=UPI0025B2FD9A|nr:EamA family transporter RarD [Sporolactobacillus laevolacticus]MDN3954956.1 EamA family transporter RarD [Sporolactobacillus laevolacticus]
MINAHDEKRMRSGVLYTFSAFSIWGFLTLYWKWLGSISSAEVLAHRIVWAFVFMLVVISVRKEFGALRAQIKWLIHQPRQLLVVTASSVSISANWIIYVWAVAHEHVIEASLGLYIIPLVSMLMGILFLKERTGVWEISSIILAVIGVLVMTVRYGHIPWLALSLAATSGVYSLSKKFVVFEAYVGMTIETMLMVPFAVVFLIFDGFQSPASVHYFTQVTGLLLIGAGILTALPLIWFAEGAKRIPLTMIGFFQYMTPSAAFLIGLFIFREPIDRIQLLSFIFIWLSIIVYAWNELTKSAATKSACEPIREKHLSN